MTHVAPFCRARHRRTSRALARKLPFRRARRGREKERGQTRFSLFIPGHYPRQCCAINTAVEPIKRRPRAAQPPSPRPPFIAGLFCTREDAPALARFSPPPTCRLMKRDRQRSRKELTVRFRGGGRITREREREKEEAENKATGIYEKRREKENERRKSLKAAAKSATRPRE